MENKTRARKPDAQGIDEIRITTVPRYKSSSMSGSEWRISGNIEFLRKGTVVHEASNHNIEGAIHMLYAHFAEAHDNGKMFFAGESDFCDQEGCKDKAAVVYKLKKEYCKNGEAHEIKYGDKIRMFCERHSKRGDCGLEDADDNYELIEGYPIEPRPEDVKKSVFGGVIDGSSLNL